MSSYFILAIGISLKRLASTLYSATKSRDWRRRQSKVPATDTISRKSKCRRLLYAHQPANNVTGNSKQAMLVDPEPSASTPKKSRRAEREIAGWKGKHHHLYHTRHADNQLTTPQGTMKKPGFKVHPALPRKIAKWTEKLLAGEVIAIIYVIHVTQTAS